MEDYITPLLKKKKELNKSSFLSFSLSFFILTPSLFFLIPTTISYQSCSYLYNKVFGQKIKSKAKLIHSPEEFAKNIIKKADDKTGRIYELVLTGATGYTGKLSAHYIGKKFFSLPLNSLNLFFYHLYSSIFIAKTYGNKLKWAIAGRNEEELSKLRLDLIKTHNLDEVKILKANLNDVDDVTRLVSQTEVVITTAGPFDKYGNLLVQYCSCKLYIYFSLIYYLY